MFKIMQINANIKLMKKQMRQSGIVSVILSSLLLSCKYNNIDVQNADAKETAEIIIKNLDIILHDLL